VRLRKEIIKVLDCNKLIESFEEIIGWRYVSPGSNDQNGIDCSGAFVRAYRLQGATIYHGSNRIIRAHCQNVFKVTDPGKLEPGMAVFKWRNDGNEPAEYKPGGGFYNPALTGNYYHIGMVCNTYPLRIIHASVPAAKVDITVTGVSGTPWSWAGYLKNVDYEGSGITMPDENTGNLMRVWAAEGSTVNLRAMPGTHAGILKRVPIGTLLPVGEPQGDWTPVKFEGVAGWMMREFLQPVAGEPDDVDSVSVPRAALERVRDEMNALLGVG